MAKDTGFQNQDILRFVLLLLKRYYSIFTKVFISIINLLDTYSDLRLCSSFVALVQSIKTQQSN